MAPELLPLRKHISAELEATPGRHLGSLDETGIEICKVPVKALPEAIEGAE